jgi:hypothetical protein
MKLGRSLPSMVSMMKLLENMEMPIHGNIVLKFLIILELQLLLKEKYFAFMQDYLQKSKQLIKLDLLIEEWRFLTKVLFAI